MGFFSKRHGYTPRQRCRASCVSPGTPRGDGRRDGRDGSVGVRPRTWSRPTGVTLVRGPPRDSEEKNVQKPRQRSKFSFVCRPRPRRPAGGPACAREPRPGRTPDGCAARRRRTRGTAHGRATGLSRAAHAAWGGAAPVPPPVLRFFVDRATSPDKKVDVPKHGSGSTKVTSPIHD